MGCAGSTEQEVRKTVEPEDNLAELEAKKQKQAEDDAHKKTEQDRIEKEALIQREAKEAVDKAEKEANEAAAVAIANQLAADLAEKKIEEARQAGIAAQEAQERQIMESFKGMGAKLRFRAAIKEGKMDVAEDAAACMLQGTWRAKCARRKMQFKKAEKQRLMEEGQARKLQSLYRCRLARKSVAAKREEKRKLIEAEEARREEASASRLEEVIVQVKEIVPELKKGFIKKEGQLRHSTKNRFFVLRIVSGSESVLTYFVSERSEAPFGVDEKGSLSLKGAKLKEPVNLNMTLSGADGRELKLTFASLDDLAAWRSAFEIHLQYSNKKVEIVGTKTASL